MHVNFAINTMPTPSFSDVRKNLRVVTREDLAELLGMTNRLHQIQASATRNV